MTMEPRIKALKDLIHVREPIPKAVSNLRRFPWDSDAALVTLTGRDLLRILDGYLCGELSEVDVEEWAEAIEGRDDVGYEPELADTLRQVVFCLANPLLTTPLGPELAGELKDTVSGGTRPRQ